METKHVPTDHGLTKIDTTWDVNGHINTDLCCDVKTILREDSITQHGKGYHGILTRDDDDHYRFVETVRCPSDGKRNDHLFLGRYITATIRDDGSIRLNFKPLKEEDLRNLDAYAISVCNEIRDALKGLVEK